MAMVSHGSFGIMYLVACCALSWPPFSGEIPRVEELMVPPSMPQPLCVLAPLLGSGTSPRVSWAVPGMWWVMLSHMVCVSPQQSCCKFDDGAATLDKAGLETVVSPPQFCCKFEAGAAMVDFGQDSGWSPQQARCETDRGAFEMTKEGSVTAVSPQAMCCIVGVLTKSCCCFFGALVVTFPRWWLLCVGHCTALLTWSLSSYAFVWCVEVPEVMCWVLCAAMLVALHCRDDGGLASWDTCWTQRALCPTLDGFQLYLFALLRLQAAMLGCALFLVWDISGYFCFLASFVAAAWVLSGIPDGDDPRVTNGKGMGKELRKAKLTLAITRFFILHSLQVCGEVWNAAAAFFEVLCVRTCVSAAASCASAYLFCVFVVQYDGCGILGLSLFMRLLALGGVLVPSVKLLDLHTLMYVLTLVGHFMEYGKIICVFVGFSVRQYWHLVGMATTTKGETGRSPLCVCSVAAAAGAAAAASSPPPEVLLGERKFQVLVRTLAGPTVSLYVHDHISDHCLCLLIAEKVGVPTSSFYILLDGKMWKDGTRLKSGDVVQMVGRLRGGTRQPLVYIPGQWTCTACGMEGCWPSRSRCYRCLAPRSDSHQADSSQPVLGKGKQRERAYPGQLPVNHAPVNPTFRVAKKAKPMAPVPPGPVPPPPQEAPQVNLDDSTAIAQVIQLLASLGVSDQLLQQVKSSIPPPATNKPKTIGPEKQLQIISGKLNVLNQQVNKLTKTRNRLTQEMDECHKQYREKTAQIAELEAEYRAVRDNGKFTPTQATPAPSVATAVSVGGDDIGDTAMSDVARDQEGSVTSEVAEAFEGVDPTVGTEPPLVQTVQEESRRKRRCVVPAPSMEAVFAGRYHYSLDQCRSLITALQERVNEGEDFESSINHLEGGHDGGPDPAEEMKG